MIQSFVVSFLYSDIDECSADSSSCDENADCTNTDGSFRCTCKQGFTGDGENCQGMDYYREMCKILMMPLIGKSSDFNFNCYFLSLQLKALLGQ